jgi:hypothetical protein
MPCNTGVVLTNLRHYAQAQATEGHMKPIQHPRLPSSSLQLQTYQASAVLFLFLFFLSFFLSFFLALASLFFFPSIFAFFHSQFACALCFFLCFLIFVLFPFRSFFLVFVRLYRSVERKPKKKGKQQN